MPDAVFQVDQREVENDERLPSARCAVAQNERPQSLGGDKLKPTYR